LIRACARREKSHQAAPVLALRGVDKTAEADLVLRSYAHKGHRGRIAEGFAETHWERVCNLLKTNGHFLRLRCCLDVLAMGARQSLPLIGQLRTKLSTPAANIFWASLKIMTWARFLRFVLRVSNTTTCPEACLAWLRMPEAVRDRLLLAKFFPELREPTCPSRA
jgi:hypothetical protein